MHQHTLFAALALIVFTGVSLSGSAQELPRRKSGLWEITMENSAAPKGRPARVMTQCVDAAKDDIARQMGQQMEKDNKCSKSRITQLPGRISFESACDFGESKMTAQTMITGDFNSSYKMEIKSKYSPPMMGMSESTTVMDAKFVGACKPGMRAGDVSMPGMPAGMTMNIYDMMDGTKK